MALAPAAVHPTPARLSLAPICLHPASTTPEETDYTREAGVWDLAGALSALCAKVVRRRAAGHGLEEHENEEPRRGRREQRDEDGQGEHDEQEGNEAPFEVTPETVVEMLGAPAHADARSIWNGRSCSRFVHSKGNINEPGNGSKTDTRRRGRYDDDPSASAADACGRWTNWTGRPWLAELGVNGALRTAAVGAIVGCLAQPASERANRFPRRHTSG